MGALKADDKLREALTYHKDVTSLLYQSYQFNADQEYQMALQKGREAQAAFGTLKELLLELDFNLGDNVASNASHTNISTYKNKFSDDKRLELAYSVDFNLAYQLESNEMYGEALKIYQQISKEKSYNLPVRAKINIAGIYHKQGYNDKALKYYRMSLDQLPESYTSLREKLMLNIGLILLKMNRYKEGVIAFKHLCLEGSSHSNAIPNSLHSIKALFYLLTCYCRQFEIIKHAATQGQEDDGGSYKEAVDNIKDTFRKLITVQDPFKNTQLSNYFQVKGDDTQHISRRFSQQMTQKGETFIDKKKQELEKLIISAVHMISPIVGNTFSVGFDWCMENLSTSSIEVPGIVLYKAWWYAKQYDFSKAIEIYESLVPKLDNKDDDTTVSKEVREGAAVNLAFIYMIHKNLDAAEQYLNYALSINADNTQALVNLGTCSFHNNDCSKAVKLYEKALKLDENHVEAKYNLGLALKKLKQLPAALNEFSGLGKIVEIRKDVLPNFSAVQLYHQVGDVLEQQGNHENALSWYLRELALNPLDPEVLMKLAHVYDEMDEKVQAYHYFLDSFRCLPSSLDSLEWISAYYMRLDLPEKALPFLKLASTLESEEIKWALATAGCLKKMGESDAALKLYESAHRNHPRNIECLTLLARLSQELKVSNYYMYETELKALENANLQKGRQTPKPTSHTLNMINSEVKGEDKKSDSDDEIVIDQANTDNFWNIKRENETEDDPDEDESMYNLLP